MRDDATKDESFKQNEVWRRQKYKNEVLVKSDKNAAGDFLAGRAFTTNSLSGNERNRTFLQVDKNFADVSTISGADDLSDGRSFALLDYDGDGWQDIALMSLNAPRFKLYRNRMGELFPSRKALTIQLVGGQTTANASTEFSNRDGIGAKVFATFGDGRKMILHRQAGEGFASQNSSRLRVGLDAGETIKSLEVVWPSGKISRVETPDTESVCVVREN